MLPQNFSPPVEGGEGGGEEKHVLKIFLHPSLVLFQLGSSCSS